jgi:hypothetical protein
MGSGIISPLTMAHSIEVGAGEADALLVHDEPVGKDVSLDDIFYRFIDLEAAVA